MKNLKNICWIIFFFGILALYIAIIHIFDEEAFWRFLFIYQTPMPQITIGVVVAMILPFLIHKMKFKNEKSRIKKDLIRIFVFLALFFLIYSLSEVVVRSIFYKTANKPVLIEAKIDYIKYISRSSKLVVSTMDGEELTLKWNQLEINKKSRKEGIKKELEVLSNLSLKKGDIILLKGRGNKFGIAVDQIIRKDGEGNM